MGHIPRPYHITYHDHDHITYHDTSSLAMTTPGGKLRLFSAVHVTVPPRSALVTLPLPGLLLRMQLHNADFCPLHPAVVLVHAQPDQIALEDRLASQRFAFSSFKASTWLWIPSSILLVKQVGVTTPRGGAWWGVGGVHRCPPPALGHAQPLADPQAHNTDLHHHQHGSHTSCPIQPAHP
jgi:hypothetical protein